MSRIYLRRLSSRYTTLATGLFRLIASEYGETFKAPGDEHLSRLLRNRHFFALSATADGKIIGGLTAQALPMVNQPAYELFVYNLVVDKAWRRKGIAVQLLKRLQRIAGDNDIHSIFIAADPDDPVAPGLFARLDAEFSNARLYLLPAEPGTKKS
ncbi:GNAT family N-acetyltransferase [Granulosicoccaceae sp. 1_MG-2023]|nr:GNAT family N-acetyltransferase [Granulosicoccaceae sp. 1_MG-2023]